MPAYYHSVFYRPDALPHDTGILSSTVQMINRHDLKRKCLKRRCVQELSGAI